MIDFIKVGKIVNTHGIKGEMKVLPLTDDMTRFDELEYVYIENQKVEIEDVWYKKNFVMLKFKDFDNINDVLCFKGKYIYIDRENAIELPEDTYFIFQIIGLNVYLKDGRFIGEIKDIIQTGSNDVYVVRDGNKEYLIPAIKEVVKEINLDDNKVIIDPLEGMIE
ncbi:ribosome maturation factor RimM [Caloranaerobacter azorensis]|uniref:Ribosome maturation factor RimM n=3 Tax=Caloranaerobacter azorensis TaxID=116090 RepID=A0A1M5RNS1_9FIRM|nr:ribosome maturation factor RimM [Caloranaerobacter azorensis]KGG80776.1 16S rRNA processing protein RimM [Caloranaerobacter azorensis H53214]QIB26217.1 ribosome maturation factor RimM [Caloranaerobacter azorensis]SHH27944.1 16S rRNA processing protein RimM [Caloranaerobacter azorensis DSM 13643]